MATHPNCTSCHGTGEMPTDYGPADCPDCGGAGFLPSAAVLTEWRAGDIERELARDTLPGAGDVQWLLAEVRKCRKALNEVVALAHDVHDTDAIAMRIRITAGRALGLYAPTSRTTEQEATG